MSQPNLSSQVNKDRTARVLSAIGIIVSIIGFVYSIVNNNLNRGIQMDQFYLNNVPTVTIPKVLIGNSKNNSGKLFFSIFFYNNSNQTIEAIFQTSTILNKKVSVLRDLTYGKTKVNVYNSSSLITQYIQPYDTGGVVFTLDERDFELSKNSSIIHLMFIFKSEKSIIFDKYLFIQLQHSDTLINDPAFKILDTNSINIVTFDEVSNKYTAFLIKDFKYDTKVYLTKEREKLFEIFGVKFSNKQLRLLTSSQFINPKEKIN